MKTIKSFKVQTQLLGFFLLVFSFIIGALAILLSLQSQFLMTFIEQYTTEIVAKTNAKYVNVSFHGELNNFETILQKNFEAMTSIKLAYEFIKEHPQFAIAEPSQCLTYYVRQFKESNICYNLAGLPFGGTLSPQQYNNTLPYFNLVSLLQMMLPMFDSQQLAVGNWSIGQADVNLFAAYQATQYFPNFMPATRPFYQDHLKNINKGEFIFSDVFFNLDKEYKLTITTNLSQTFEGLIAVQFGLKTIKQFFNSNFLILNTEGLILMGECLNSKPNLNQTQIYFFNESTTGYTVDDWAQIIKFTTNEEFSSNCNTQQQRLCRVNQLSGMDTILLAQRMENPNFIYIIQIEARKDPKIVNQIHQIHTNLNQIYYDQIYYLLIAGGILMLCFVLILKCTIEPINQIIQISLNLIFQQSMKERCEELKKSVIQEQTDTTIKGLQLGFLRLSNFAKPKSSKSLECQKLQEQQYPIDHQFLGFGDNLLEEIEDDCQIYLDSDIKKWITQALNKTKQTH